MEMESSLSYMKMLNIKIFSIMAIITYKTANDLLSTLDKIKLDEKKIKKRSMNAKKSYFNYFENTIISDYLLHKIFDTKPKYNFVWNK